MKTTLASILGIYVGFLVWGAHDLLMPATAVLLVILAVFYFRPPEKKSGYRMTTGMLAAFTLCLAFDWFSHYEVGRLYFREGPHALLLLPATLLVASSFILVWEFFSLRIYGWRIARGQKG